MFMLVLRRSRGKYGKFQDDMLLWGNAVRLTRGESEQGKYTAITMHQHDITEDSDVVGPTQIVYDKAITGLWEHYFVVDTRTGKMVWVNGRLVK